MVLYHGHDGVHHGFIKGEWTDQLIYAILRSEWDAAQAAS
jgi:hypothetical protein